MIETDALIIGAGPVGLFQAFQLGLLEISAHIIDALPHAGGQCIELYADKPIYDIPGVPATTGRELIASLLQQVAPLKPQFHWNQLVSRVALQPDGRILVASHTGTTFITRTLFIAAGVGAFQPRMPALEGLAEHLGTQVHTALPQDANGAGQNVLILGDTDAALEAAIALAQTAIGSVTLMHRRQVFAAAPATVARFDTLLAGGQLRFVAGQPSGIQTADSRLNALDYVDAQGETQTLPLDNLLVLQGLSPKLGPSADWGLAMERRQLTVNTETFATAVPGIFAVGDINTYPGKKKLILCGFHETVLAAFAAAAHIAPQKRRLLEYTTSSSRLHKLLGVESSAAP